MIAVILTALILVILMFAMLAPLDSLRWWEKQGTRTHHVLAQPETDTLPRRSDSDVFLIYLSGIAAVTGTYDNAAERAMLAELAERVPHATIVADVYAYAPDNRGLTQGVGARFWGTLADWQRTSKMVVKTTLSGLIQIRNMMRVMVSADPRYGPTFNLGVAQQMVDSLTRHGYDWEKRPPVVILGYSGGGQVAVGAAWYLAALDIDVSILSLAGVLSAHPGLGRIQHLWHFYGKKDGTRPLGPLLFPARWPLAVTSPWNRAQRAGRITSTCLGPMKHAEGRDYFDPDVSDENGVPYRTLTLNAIADVLDEAAGR